MKRNYVLFGVVLAMVLNVFTNSCRSDDEENFPNSKSKKIKEICLEYVDDYGKPSSFSAFLSYNSKNQLNDILYTDEESKVNNIIIDYQNKIIYKNEKQLCLFELNNKGYIESITPVYYGVNDAKKRFFEYDTNGYLVKMKGYYNDYGIYFEKRIIVDMAAYKYLNGNLITAERLNTRILNEENIEYKVRSTLTFSYSDELNINNTPAILYSLGSYAMKTYDKYFQIIQAGQGLYKDELLVQVALHYAGLFGKAPKNLCRYCGENYYSDGDDWAATYKYFFEENGNLTKITNLRTKNSYSWNFVY